MARLHDAVAGRHDAGMGMTLSIPDFTIRSLVTQAECSGVCQPYAVMPLVGWAWRTCCRLPEFQGGHHPHGCVPRRDDVERGELTAKEQLWLLGVDDRLLHDNLPPSLPLLTLWRLAPTWVPARVDGTVDRANRALLPVGAGLALCLLPPAGGADPAGDAVGLRLWRSPRWWRPWSQNSAAHRHRRPRVHACRAEMQPAAPWAAPWLSRRRGPTAARSVVGLQNAGAQFSASPCST